ncbi:MAG TPA: alpha/beta fold hydrolase [Anaerolineae bacterium]|nr:alpha/beta fold hydrolase [Anaerolineae bacterium]
MDIVYKGRDFWKNYMLTWFGEELIAKWEKYAEVKQIASVNGKINLEVYRNQDLARPTIVFSHGIAGYARLLLPFIMPLYEKGYNIIAPDLEGFGYNERKKGDFTFDVHLHNLRDAVKYARENFKGAVYLGGGSMGGPLAYAADARYNCADGLICWCLWDFADREFIQDSSTTKGLTYYLIPFLKLASKILGGVTVKTTRFVSYRALTSDPDFNSLIMEDPQSGNTISLRGALSLVTQSTPDMKHELYEKPVLVCQPEDDAMTRSYHTKKVYARLNSINKKYISFSGGHFPTDKQAYIVWGECVDEFLKGI